MDFLQHLLAPQTAQAREQPVHGLVTARVTKIEDDGSYVLRTGDAKGVTPGWHRITVAGLTAPGRASALPHRYSEALPCLCREVVPGRDNVIDLHLD